MAIVTRSGKGNALTHAELDGNFTHLSGDGTYQFPSTKGTSKQVLRMNSGATALEYATVDTDEVSEGSSNLYFTNARADARITNALKDEDNMASDSATHIPSQQSVKAYVDAQTLSLIDEDNMASDSATRPPSQQSVKAYIATQIATKDNSDEITEGSSNLYFTNARADARIAAASLTALSNVDAVTAGDDGKVLYYDHSSTSFKWKVDATGGSSYSNSDVDTHLNQSGPTSGYVLSWNGSDYAWIANGSGSSIEKSFSVQTANFNAVAGERYGINTSSNTVTATLPGSPSTGDAIFFGDSGGNYATNKLTINRNGKTIMGLAQDMDVTTNNQSFGLFYNGATWRTY